MFAHEAISNFLSDIAAFESTLAAIAIPITIGIISQIANKYNSREINELLIGKRKKLLLCLYLCLLFNIGFSISLQIFHCILPSIITLVFICLLYTSPSPRD